MKAYSLVEFNRKNITLTTKNILIYKIKTMTQTSTNTHLKEFKGFEIINRRKSEKVKKGVSDQETDEQLSYYIK